MNSHLLAYMNFKCEYQSSLTHEKLEKMNDVMDKGFENLGGAMNGHVVSILAFTNSISEMNLKETALAKDRADDMSYRV